MSDRSEFRLPDAIIPPDWSARDATIVLEFLDVLVAAIWQRHGDSIAHAALLVSEQADEFEPEYDDSDIPF